MSEGDLNMKLRELQIAANVKLPIVTYSEEGSRPTVGHRHSFCHGGVFDDDTKHECFGEARGADEEQAHARAAYIAELVNSAPKLLAVVEAAINQSAAHRANEAARERWEIDTNGDNFEARCDAEDALEDAWKAVITAVEAL